MNSFETYKILAREFPTGFTWNQAAKILDVDSGVLGSNLKILMKHGLIKGVKEKGRPRRYFPVYFKCKSDCKIRLIIQQSLKSTQETLENIIHET